MCRSDQPWSHGSVHHSVCPRCVPHGRGGFFLIDWLIYAHPVAGCPFPLNRFIGTKYSGGSLSSSCFAACSVPGFLFPISFSFTNNYSPTCSLFLSFPFFPFPFLFSLLLLVRSFAYFYYHLRFKTRSRPTCTSTLVSNSINSHCYLSEKGGNLSNDRRQFTEVCRSGYYWCGAIIEDHQEAEEPEVSIFLL